MALPWTYEQLRRRAAAGADVACFGRRGEPVAPPTELAGVARNAAGPQLRDDLEMVFSKHRAMIVGTHNRAVAEPGVVHGAEVLVQVQGHWVRLRTEFLNALHDPAFGAIVRVSEFIEFVSDPHDVRVRRESNGVPKVSLRCDLASTILAAEGSPEAIYGVGADELIGRNALEFVHPDDIGIVGDGGILTVTAPGTDAAFTHRVVGADGTILLVNVVMGVVPGTEEFRIELRDAAAALHVEMTRALSEDELFLVYQPVVDVGTGRMLGAEALLRWVHPERGFIPPLDFIPLAESSGIIIELGEWVLRTACREAATWPEDLHVAVNMSVNQLADRGIVKTVASALADTGLAPHRLTLEVTESALMENADRTIRHLRLLNDLGVRLAIDDFGTGYSSLLYLKSMPVHVLKVDRSFVAGLGEDPGDFAIVASVIGLAHHFGLQVVAEGVETELHRSHLVELGCDFGQGYLWSRPAPADQFQQLLDRPLAVSDSSTPRP